MEIAHDERLCNNCKHVVQLTNFAIHRVFCERNVFLCKICDETVPISKKQRHMEEYHVPLSCDLCKGIFEKRMLPKHMRERHSNVAVTIEDSKKKKVNEVTSENIPAKKVPPEERSQCLSGTSVTENVGKIEEELTWNIDGFFTYRSQQITSPTFAFGGCKWRLATWPNGDSLDHGSIVVCLQEKELRTSDLQTVNCILGMRRSDGTVLSSMSVVEKILETHFTWTLFCRCVLYQTELLKMRNMVAPNDRLTIFCRLSSGATPDIPEQKEISVLATLSNNLKDLFLSEEDCDVTIDVQGKKYRAHRSILRARSPVLYAMFSHDMSENNSSTISVADCDPSAFREVLLFIYSGSLENLSEENLTDVYYIADKYDLPELKKECILHMRRGLSSDSICDVIRLAARHGEQALLEEGMHFFAKNVEDILLTVKWQKFMRESTDQANELLIKAFKTGYVKKL